MFTSHLFELPFSSHVKQEKSQISFYGGTKFLRKIAHLEKEIFFFHPCHGGLRGVYGGLRGSMGALGDPWGP